MKRELSAVAPNAADAMTIVTGHGSRLTTYRIGPADKDGWREVARNDDPPYIGRIRGPVVPKLTVEHELIFAVKLNGGEYVLTNRNVEVGKPMAIETQGEPESSFCSRPIISITVA